MFGVARFLSLLVFTSAAMISAQTDTAVSLQTTDTSVTDSVASVNTQQNSENSDGPVVITTSSNVSDTMLSESERKMLFAKYKRMEEKGRHLRVGGALLISSCAFWIIGGATIAASAEDNSTTSYNDGYYTYSSSPSGQQIAGMTIGVAGGVLSIFGGIAMVVTGHIKQDKGHKNKAKYAVSFNPEYNGLSMNLEF